MCQLEQPWPPLLVLSPHLLPPALLEVLCPQSTNASFHCQGMTMAVLFLERVQPLTAAVGLLSKDGYWHKHVAAPWHPIIHSGGNLTLATRLLLDT